MQQVIDYTTGRLNVQHGDHGLSLAHWAWLWEHVLLPAVPRFVVRTVELPPELSDLGCGLYGPTVGDDPVVSGPDIVWAQRGERTVFSRMVRRPTRRTRLVTVIADTNGKAGDSMGLQSIPEIHVFTAYGGPLAPREIHDPSIASDSALLEESVAFWSVHALSAD